MQALDLDVKDHVRIQGHAFTLQNFGTELLFLRFLDSVEFVAEGLVDLRLKELELIKICFEARSDLVGNEPAQLRVTKAQPPPLGNAVGLVLETLRIQLIPVGKDVVLQDFAVQGCHAVDCVGGISGQFRHMDAAVEDNAQGWSDFFPGFFHLPAETGVNLPDDGNDLRADGGKQGQVPFFQGFLHDGVVRISKGVAGDEERVLKGNTILTKQADQFRNCHGGMGVVQLGSHFFGKEGIVAAMALPVSPKDILHRGGNQHILLLDPELFAFLFRVVGIKELGDILSLVFVRCGLGVILAVEDSKIHLVKTLRLPQAQGADVLRSEADHRHIIGNGKNVTGLHGNHDGLVQPADGPGISVFRPVVRQFYLAAVRKVLLEQTVAETETVAGQRNVAGHCAVEEAGGEATQTAVAEGVILHVFHHGDIHALFLQQGLDLVQQAHAVQVVVNQPAHQKLHGQISGLAAAGPGGFLLRPQRSQGVHCRARNGIVQFLRGGAGQVFMIFGHQALFSIPDQLFRVHRFITAFLFLYSAGSISWKAPERADRASYAIPSCRRWCRDNSSGRNRQVPGHPASV